MSTTRMQAYQNGTPKSTFSAQNHKIRRHLPTLAPGHAERMTRFPQRARLSHAPRGSKVPNRPPSL
jgi:hypothetical protein